MNNSKSKKLEKTGCEQLRLEIFYVSEQVNKSKLKKSDKILASEQVNSSGLEEMKKIPFVNKWTTQN